MIGLYAVRGTKHRHLMPWVPTLHVYFPLGCFAGWKAIYEVVVKPFYWDKTAHGIFDATDSEETPEVIPGMVMLPVLGQIGGRSLAELAAEMPQTQPVIHSALHEVTAETAPKPHADGRSKDDNDAAVPPLRLTARVG